MADVKRCRSRGPLDQACVQPRGHKPSFPDVHDDGKGSRWTGGVRTPALNYRPDSGHMSEADYQTWGRL